MLSVVISPSLGEPPVSQLENNFLFVLLLRDLLGSEGDLDSGSKSEVAGTGAELAARPSEISVWMGVIFRRNLLFLRDTSPDPSILTLYCW